MSVKVVFRVDRPIPGSVNQLSPVEQIPFLIVILNQDKTTRQLEFTSSPNVRQPVSDPGTTQDLAEHVHVAEGNGCSVR